MPLPIATVFADLPDPRRDTPNKLHRLTDILTIATCAVIAGADGRDQVAEYGRRKEAFFRRFLALPNGIPSHDTFDRVFAKLDPDAFADRFGRWAAGAGEAAGLVHVAIDGESARRSPRDTFTGCLHLVGAWAVEDHLPLGVRAVPAGGHEITTIPALVAGLDLTGAVVTVDAAGCQKGTVAQVRAGGGEYVVCVKGNQPGLRDAVAGVFDRAAGTDFAGADMAAEVGGGHGRAEERYVTVVEDPEGLPDGWAGVGAVALVCREREVGGKANESTAHYYLTSLRVPAAVLAGYIRAHWGIENGPHWVLDVAFREDESRTRTGHAGANLGMVRRVAVSLLKRAGTTGSIQTRRMKAAWDDDYMLKVLQEIALGECAGPASTTGVTTYSAAAPRFTVASQWGDPYPSSTPRRRAARPGHERRTPGGGRVQCEPVVLAHPLAGLLPLLDPDLEHGVGDAVVPPHPPVAGRAERSEVGRQSIGRRLRGRLHDRPGVRAAPSHSGPSFFSELTAGPASATHIRSAGYGLSIVVSSSSGVSGSSQAAWGSAGRMTGIKPVVRPGQVVRRVGEGPAPGGRKPAVRSSSPNGPSHR